jgi:hypothetical protein
LNVLKTLKTLKNFNCGDIVGIIVNKKTRNFCFGFSVAEKEGFLTLPYVAVYQCYTVFIFSSAPNCAPPKWT